MKVLYLHQYYKTPEDGGAIRSYYLSQEMQKFGFEVQMVTSHNGKTIVTENHQGVRVHYLPVFYQNSLSKWQRILAFVKFWWMAFRYARNLEYDLVYATSTPLTVGLLGWILKGKKKFVFEVRDLWPEAPIQLGFIRNQFLKLLLYWLEKKLYQVADKVVVLSPMAEEYVWYKSPNTETIFAPNMSEIQYFANDLTKVVEGIKCIVYTGTFGFANNISYLKSLADCVEKTNDFHFKMIGGGAFFDEMVSYTKDMNSVEVLSLSNKNEVLNILNEAHFALVSFSGQEVLRSCSPNKFFDALAAGVPVIVNYKGWIKNLVEDYQCGFYSETEKVHDLIQNLRDLDQNKYSKMSQNAFLLAKEQFDHKIITQKIIKELKSLFE